MIGLNGNNGFLRANLLKPLQIKEEEIEPKGPEPSPETETPPETKPVPEENGAVVKLDSSKMKMLLANFAINIGELGNKGDAKANEAKKQYKFAGYETAEEARKAYNLPKDTFEQFFEVKERDDGRFIVEPKPPYSSCSSVTQECQTGMGYELDADGNPTNFTPIMGEYTTYTLTSLDGSGSVKITYGDNTLNGAAIQYLDANGKPLDSDATFRGSSIDASVIEGYGDGKYDSVELHERGKGKAGSVEKMEDKATELLNTKDFKSQVLAQYKAMCAARGETFNEKAFEALYQQAIDATLQEDGVITSRGARGLSSKGHAWCNTWTLVNTF